ncbi:envelope stress response membrane protein PspC [uncultured Sphingomonas sp.]|uniref:envelope stress response membrane protein PspC n=1 Tax=uncultured Sphingomonas sp. TaxID=158754 RepID=UPI0035C967C5
MSASRTQFYLDTPNGKVKGVCAGVADYTGIDVRWVRAGAVILLPLTHLFILAAYFIAAWVAPEKPAGLYRTADDERFWQGVRSNTKRSTTEVRSKFRDIDRRLADMETFYTSRNTQLSSEIEKLR